MKQLLIIMSILFFLSGCISMDDKPESNTKEEIGDIPINYYSNKSVSSLEIPPDLTAPDMQKSFRLSEMVVDINENFVSFSESQQAGSQKVLVNPVGIVVNKSGPQRWLEIDKKPEDVWIIAKEFIKLQGFIIEKENRKTGIIETNFLENRPDIPDESLGMIRAALGRALNQKYTFASIDKYRIRIEPKDNNKTSLFLSLISMEEIVDPRIIDAERIGETAWKAKPKDFSLETEMLYRLMIYLGGDDAKNKIEQAKKINKIQAKVDNALNGYAKLAIEANLSEAWDQLSFAIDANNINIDDKDIQEKSFYIEGVRTADKGIMSRMFGDEPIKKIFKLSLKEIDKNLTEVYFIDLSNMNEAETKEYSFDLFNQLATFFK